VVRSAWSADERAAGDRGELPEHEHREHVVRGDDAQHRAGEQRERRREALEVLARRVVTIEVGHGVREDEDADARDHESHEAGEAVDAERERQAEVRHPGDALVGRAVAGGEKPHHPGERGEGAQPERVAAKPGGEDCCGDRSQHMRPEHPHHRGCSLAGAGEHSRPRPLCAPLAGGLVLVPPPGRWWNQVRTRRAG
jgi:hypothetical protein